MHILTELANTTFENYNRKLNLEELEEFQSHLAGLVQIILARVGPTKVDNDLAH